MGVYQQDVCLKYPSTRKTSIYCVECSEYLFRYVGQTHNKFLNGVNQHFIDVKHNKDTPVARHFNKKCQITYCRSGDTVNRTSMKTIGYHD